MTDRALTAHIDLRRLDRNLRRFHERATASGVAVRAHVKGHRTVEIALRQMRRGASGIAVTQVAQARRYLAAGITDILIAHPWRDPWRWRLIAGLARDCRLSVLADAREAVAGLAAAAASAGSVVGVRVRLGDGGEDPAGLARAVCDEPALRLDGVHAYRTPEAAADRLDVGRAAAADAVRAAGLLRAEGLPCPAVAVSGTPTAAGAIEVPGVTEVCAGAYALHDSGMAAIGVCAPEDVAVSVVAADPVAADPILAAYPYPWQSPADYELVASSAAARTPVHPPHVCALMQQLDEVTAGEETPAIWHVLNQGDEPPDAARTA